MPLIGCTTVFNKGADGEGHFEVCTKLNKIKIFLFIVLNLFKFLARIAKGIYF